MTTATQLVPLGKAQWTDGDGNPLVGGNVYFYVPGTTTPKTTWQDQGGTTPNLNPVPLNARGEAIVWGNGTYRQMVYDVNGNLIYDVVTDTPMSASALGNITGVGGASLIGFDGTTLDQILMLRLNRIVDSVAGLRSLSKLLYGRAFVTGYYLPHDGGGGAYQLDPSDTTSADNGGTIIVASDGGRWKLQHIGSVSIRQFGAKGDGTTDDTASMQNGLSAGLPSLFVPDGTFVTVAGLAMPTTVGFVLSGNGTSSIIKQSGSAPALRYPGPGIAYTQGVIRNLSFDGTSGTNNTVDTSFSGGLTLENLYFNNTPAGLSSLYINGSATTYTHDIRVRGIQIYSNTAGAAGITFGPTASDIQVSGFIMNGNFVVSHAAEYKVGASSIRMTDSHPYNTVGNIVLLDGSNNGCVFTDVTFDNANADLVYNQNNAGIIFNGCRFQAVQSGFNGLTNSNCSNTLLIGCKWDGVVGAHSAVYDFGTTVATTVLGGIMDTPSNFAIDFNIAASSVVRFVDNNNPLGITVPLIGLTQSPVPQNSSTFLGPNGAAAAVVNAAWPLPFNCNIVGFFVIADQTPPAGQTFSFNIHKNGSTIGIGTISNGNYSVNIPLNVLGATNDSLDAQVFMSATSGSANFRYYFIISG
ncbi:hypothetical protein DF057_28640 [Burkholderia cepacia]|uniref:glycosyl hydrolase family 28-related protein n=1 Tax=Burkholderia cepacia TaxID=292 RepID=UPI000F5DAEF2|nr:glycosyl hydrolase family 28-related protein [Burkholderia cepacia]RQZ57415.1 hypothetical protein DF057_28640 [Burkholderia cepacia]